MTSRRIRVPDGIAIVGYDDVDFAAAAAVPLSSVRQPRHQLGRAAAQLLLEEALGDGTHRHRQVVFEPDLVVRASSQGRARRPRKARPARGGPPAGPGQWHGRMTRMRIALFVTCLADTPVPGGRAGDGGAAGAARAPGGVPGRPDLLRADARQHRVPAGGTAAGAALRGGFRGVRGHRGPVRLVHRVGPAPARDDGPAVRRRGAGPARPRRSRPAPTSCPSCSPTCSGWRMSGPITRTGSPTTRPATRCGCCGSGDRPLRLLRQVRGHRPGRTARRRRVLRLRRHVRGEERRRVHGDAGRQDAQRAGHPAPRCAPPGTARA